MVWNAGVGRKKKKKKKEERERERERERKEREMVVVGKTVENVTVVVTGKRTSVVFLGKQVAGVTGPGAYPVWTAPKTDDVTDNNGRSRTANEIISKEEQKENAFVHG